MRILLIGSGGREHALAWKISQSRHTEKLFILPGNAGTLQTGENVSINPSDFKAISQFVLDHHIDMVVVGPEDPLVKGIYDYFNDSPNLRHIAVIGPSKAAAQLEGSKDFAKAFMKKYGIPTARYCPVTSGNLGEGISFLKNMQPPYVLKADGLAAGKGVLILQQYDEAENELKKMLEGKFGEASKKVVIEEHLKGIELSAFVVTDGDDYKLLPEAKDYKRVGEGDTGPNTGGMGAVSPVPFATKEFMAKVEQRIIKPTVEGIHKEGLVYKGFIFFGLMNCNGDPYVIEYNVRLGDPESEVILPRLQCDFVELLLATAQNKINSFNISFDPRSVATVMLVSGGYPGDYEKGKVIKNLDKVNNSIVFHAGTKAEGNKILTSGGRILAISSFGMNYEEALKISNTNAALIEFENKYYRKDIGFDLVF